MNSIIVLEIVSGDDNISLNSINVTFELFFSFCLRIFQ